MTVDEAIKMLKKAKLSGDADYYRDLGDAVKLGVEALSYYQILRVKGIVIPDYLLPGETKERR